MSRRTRRVVLAGAVLALVVVAVIVARVVLERTDGSRLDDALEVVPAEALRVGFTDWAATRRITGVAQTDDPDDIQRLVDEAYDRDLSAASSIIEGPVGQQAHFGFSPGNVEWEVLAQAREGSALVLRLADDIDVADVRAALEEAGFTKPERDTGVWKGGVDLVSGLDAGLGSLFQHMVVLEDQHLVVASDNDEYVAEAAETVRGETESLAEADDTESLTASVAEPVVSALLWSRDFACEDLALSQGGPEDQERGDAVIAEAGGVGPISGLLMARPAGRTLVVVERYEDEDRARRDLEARAKLAVGEAVGRGGTFDDEFELTSSRTDGANVVLRLKGREGNSFLMSSVHNGPVIFAAC